MSLEFIDKVGRWLDMGKLYGDDVQAGKDAMLAEKKAKGIEVPEELPVEAHPLPSPPGVSTTASTRQMLDLNLI